MPGNEFAEQLLKRELHRLHPGIEPNEEDWIIYIAQIEAYTSIRHIKMSSYYLNRNMSLINVLVLFIVFLTPPIIPVFTVQVFWQCAK